MEEKILNMISEMEKEAGRLNAIKNALVPQKENLPIKYTAADVAEIKANLWNEALKMVSSAFVCEAVADNTSVDAAVESAPVPTTEYLFSLKDNYDGSWTGKITVPENVPLETIKEVIADCVSIYRTTYNASYVAGITAKEHGWNLEEVKGAGEENMESFEITLEPSPVFVKHTEAEYEQMIDKIIKPLTEGMEKLNDNPKMKEHILSHWNEYNLVNSEEEMLKLLNILEAHEENLDTLHDISMGNTSWLCGILFNNAPTDREVKDDLFEYNAFYKSKKELIQAYVICSAENDEIFEECIQYELILESSDGYVRVFEY